MLTVNHFADIYGMPSMCQTVGPREEVLSLFFKVFFFFYLFHQAVDHGHVAS